MAKPRERDNTLDLFIPNFSIRSANDDDIEEITDIFIDAYPDGTEYPFVQEQNVENIITDVDHEVFVTEDREGEIVATGSIEHDSINEGNAQIGKLAVKRDYRGNGLGYALLVYRMYRLLAANSFSGIIYSAAATSHPASQINLAKAGFKPFAVHRKINEGYFGERETEVMMVYPPSIKDRHRDIFVPEEYKNLVANNIQQVFPDMGKRELRDVKIEGTFDPRVEESGDRDFLIEITSSFSGKPWTELKKGISDVVDKEDKEHMMVPIDANSLDLLVIYEKLNKSGFIPAGFVPDWLSNGKENRDALILQYSPQDVDTEICVIDDVRYLMDVLNIQYEVVDVQDRYWRVMI